MNLGALASSELDYGFSGIHSKFFHRDDSKSKSELCELVKAIEDLDLVSIDVASEKWANNREILVKGICALESRKSTPLDSALESAFKQLTPHAIDDLLKALAVASIKEKNERLADSGLNYLSLDQIDEIFKENSKKTSTVKDFAEFLHKNYPESPDSALKKSFWLEMKRIFSFIINFIPNLINTFLIAFSLYDIGKEPQSAWEASALLDVYYKFVMIPAAIVVVVSFLLPSIGASVYAITLGVLLATATALIVYIKWLRPCPASLPHCQNLTLDAKLGYLTPVIGREEEIQKLVSLFTSLDDNSSRHALLVGSSGVGKTEIVRGLAQRIAQGDVPKQLLGKKIFVINTASLVQGGMWGYADQMNVLMNRIKGYEKEVVFFFDEIHVALKNKSCLSDFLKPLLDRGKIHCIAATTTEEFNKYIKGSSEKPGDPAFARRFEKIDVEDMTDGDTKRVLQALSRDSSRSVHIEDSALDTIIEKTKAFVATQSETALKRHQPAFAVEVLTHAVNTVAASHDPTFQPLDLTEKKSTLDSLRQSLTAHCNNFRSHTNEGRDLIEKIQNLEEEILQLEKQNSENNTLIKDVKTLLALQKQHLQAVGNLAKEALNADEKIQKQRLKHLFFETEYYLPGLQKMIEEIKKQVCSESFRVSVDSLLVEKIIDEMIRKDEQVVKEEKV